MGDQCCGKCRFLDVKPDKLGRRIVRALASYRCLAPVPEMPALPDSVTQSYGYTPMTSRQKTIMESVEGKTCPTFEQWEQR